MADQELLEKYAGDCVKCNSKAVDCCVECERCSGCCRCRVFGQWDYPIAWDAERYAFITQKHSDLTDFVESRTTAILKRLGHRGWLSEFDEYNVTYEWNDSCNCHPSLRQAKFPADWIFAEDWEAKVDTEVAKQKAKQQAVELKNQQIKEEQDRKQYEKLKAKFA